MNGDMLEAVNTNENDEVPAEEELEGTHPPS
jgi:hypothetical protein